MGLNPFGARSPKNASTSTGTDPAGVIAERARAVQAKESADARRAARRAGETARAAQTRTIDENEAALERALTALGRFSAGTAEALLADLDGPDPLSQYSVSGYSPGSLSGLPAWLRERCLLADADRVVRDTLAFRAAFVSYKEFSAGDNPLPQLYEALELSDGQSIAVDGVAALGREACDRLFAVAFSLRAAQRALVTRRIGTETGYAASDRWRVFDLTNRFVTPDLVRWLVADAPSDALVALRITAGDFSTVETDPLAGRHTGVSPHEVDEAGLLAELKRRP
jgi:hypothetical protein